MRKKSKKDKRRITIFFLTMCALAIWFSFIAYDNLSKIVNNYKMEKKLIEKYNNLLDDETFLQNNIVKLEDPDYMAKYAREKHLYSKEGELLLRVLKKEQSENK